MEKARGPLSGGRGMNKTRIRALVAGDLVGWHSDAALSCQTVCEARVNDRVARPKSTLAPPEVGRAL